LSPNLPSPPSTQKKHPQKKALFKTPNQNNIPKCEILTPPFLCPLVSCFSVLLFTGSLCFLLPYLHFPPSSMVVRVRLKNKRPPSAPLKRKCVFLQGQCSPSGHQAPPTKRRYLVQHSNQPPPGHPPTFGRPAENPVPLPFFSRLIHDSPRSIPHKRFSSPETRACSFPSPTKCFNQCLSSGSLVPQSILWPTPVFSGSFYRRSAN